MKRFFSGVLAWILGLGLGGPGLAATAEITGVELFRRPNGTWDGVFQIDHEDEGRHHFCDRWEAIDQDGRRVLVRNLFEPKLQDVEEEGPVRRKHTGFTILDSVLTLRFRAHCKRSGWSNTNFEVDLAKLRGEGFTVAKTRRKKLLPATETIADSPHLSWRKKYFRRKRVRIGPPARVIPLFPPDPLVRAGSLEEPSQPCPPEG